MCRFSVFSQIYANYRVNILCSTQNVLFRVAPYKTNIPVFEWKHTLSYKNAGDTSHLKLSSNYLPRLVNPFTKAVIRRNCQFLKKK